jgi:anti-sigma factor RsiW
MPRPNVKQDLPANADRSQTMSSLDLSKRDMTVVYGDRTFALRAYREDQTWRGVIIENRTPIHHWLTPAADPAACFAAAVGFLAATVDAAGTSRGGKW